MKTASCNFFFDLTLREWYDISRLRERVFVVEQQCPYLDADGKDLQGWHCQLRQDDQLVAYSRLLPIGVAYPDFCSIGRVVTAPEVRGAGWGQALMRYSIQELEQRWGAVPIKIGAQSYLLAFYRSLGFEPVGEEYLEDGIPHHTMVRPATTTA